VKALVLEEYGRFSYRDVPEPEVGPDDVLVRIEACGICGSDVHGMDGSTGRRIPPIVMGHEAAGVIAGAGARVKGYPEGRRVTFDSTIYCGTCFFCRRGEINLCDNRRVLGVSCAEYRQPGAFAQYISVPQRILYPLPDDLSFERAVMTEPLSVAMHAARRVPPLLGASAVIVGAGTIGLLVIQCLRASGCGLIVAVDVARERLDHARRLGADHVLDSTRADVHAEILRLTEGRGVDAAFEAVGIPATFALALGCLRKGGALSLVGNIAASVDLALQAAVTREITLYGSCASAGEYPACMELMSRGKVDVDALISATAPLSEGPGWFERLSRGEKGLLKVILKP
jgi:L-iditol 2-dehydrogenase